MTNVQYQYCWFVLLIGFLLGSCTSKKNLIYFQDKLDTNTSSLNYNPIFHKDDLVSITVMGIDPEAVLPFNLPITQLNTGSLGGYAQGAPTPPGYLIDGDGNIDFPVIGKIKMGGLTRVAAMELLKDELQKYINKPTVNIRILNYKITVLGEVRNPGTFTIPNERVTLLEALGIAGDLQITGVRQNVLVVRDTDGKKTETRIDLTSTQLFNSPVYYLQQNDIVYVQPNRAKINSSVINASNVGIVISAVSVLISALTLTTILSRTGP